MSDVHQCDQCGKPHYASEPHTCQLKEAEKVEILCPNCKGEKVIHYSTGNDQPCNVCKGSGTDFATPQQVKDFGHTPTPPEAQLQRPEFKRYYDFSCGVCGFEGMKGADEYHAHSCRAEIEKPLLARLSEAEGELIRKNKVFLDVQAAHQNAIQSYVDQIEPLIGENTALKSKLDALREAGRKVIKKAYPTGGGSFPVSLDELPAGAMVTVPFRHILNLSKALKESK